MVVHLMIYKMTLGCRGSLLTSFLRCLDVLRLNHLKISLDFSETIWYNIITEKGTEFPTKERNFRKNESLL